MKNFRRKTCVRPGLLVFAGWNRLASLVERQSVEILMCTIDLGGFSIMAAFCETCWRFISDVQIGDMALMHANEWESEWGKPALIGLNRFRHKQHLLESQDLY